MMGATTKNRIETVTPKPDVWEYLMVIGLVAAFAELLVLWAVAAWQVLDWVFTPSH